MNCDISSLLYEIFHFEGSLGCPNQTIVLHFSIILEMLSIFGVVVATDYLIRNAILIMTIIIC